LAVRLQRTAPCGARVLDLTEAQSRLRGQFSKMIAGYGFGHWSLGLTRSATWAGARAVVAGDLAETEGEGAVAVEYEVRAALAERLLRGTQHGHGVSDATASGSTCAHETARAQQHPQSERAAHYARSVCASASDASHSHYYTMSATGLLATSERC